MKTQHLIFFFLLGLQIPNTWAVVSSIRPGNWDEPATWEGGAVPGTNENIVIHHHIYKHGDLKTTGGSLNIEDGGILEVAGTLSLKGITNLLIAGGGQVKCQEFRTYTVAGFASIIGQFHCSKFNIGGTITLEVLGNMSGEALDLKGNAELFVDGGHLRLDSNLLIQGFATIGMENAEVVVGGTLEIVTDWDMYCTNSNIRIKKDFNYTKGQSLHLAGSHLSIAGKFVAVENPVIWVSERGELAVNSLELSAEASIQGSGSGGILKCQKVLIEDSARISSVGAKYVFTHENYSTMPNQLDLGIYQALPETPLLPNTLPSVKSTPLKVSVYPNPTADIINIEGLQAMDNPQLILTNAAGQQQQLDLSHSSLATFHLKGQFTPGIYSLTILDGNVVQNIQLVLQ